MGALFMSKPANAPLDASPGGELPRRTRAYHNHHLDSSMWDGFQPRPDDIFITTAYKSGTTWTQQIVAMLVFQGEQPSVPLGELSPWLDMRIPPREVKLPLLEAQRHRRFIKSHLPIDGIPFYPQCKYIYVGRDGRDVFMSMFNHYRRGSEAWYDVLNNTPGRVGPPLPPCPEDPRDLWQSWISRGWFEWERDGYPWWSFFDHVRTWWQYRHLPNILFVHFANLKRDLPAEIRRIAGFLEIPIDADRFPTILRRCSFEYMKESADLLLPGEFWEGGASTFFHKGSNGRWRDVLTREDVAHYDALVADRLPPDCARWLETGEG
jgi:aryl sulfotransferase